MDLLADPVDHGWKSQTSTELWAMVNDPWKRHKSPARLAQASARGRLAPDLGLLHQPNTDVAQLMNPLAPGLYTAVLRANASSETVRFMVR